MEVYADKHAPGTAEIIGGVAVITLERLSGFGVIIQFKNTVEQHAGVWDKC